MNATRLRRIIGIFILLLSLGILLWGLWPFNDAVRTVPVRPGDLQLPTPASLLPLLFGVA